MTKKIDSKKISSLNTQLRRVQTTIQAIMGKGNGTRKKVKAKPSIAEPNGEKVLVLRFVTDFDHATLADNVRELIRQRAQDNDISGQIEKLDGQLLVQL